MNVTTLLSLTTLAKVSPKNGPQGYEEYPQVGKIGVDAVHEKLPTEVNIVKKK